METLYHYCTANAFISILASRRIWLSSLTLSNDYHEGKVVHDVFKRIIAREGVDPESYQKISATLESFERNIDGLGFCLSGDGDLLSQWRGYAADGQGFSIGFSKKYLESLSSVREPSESGFTLNKVIYSPEEQESEVMPAYNAIREEVRTGALKIPMPPGLLTGFGDPTAQERYEKAMKDSQAAHMRLFGTLLSELPNFYALKNSAFQEEQEYRLVSFLIKGAADKCLFRSSGDQLIPYREFELKPLETPPVSHVVLGPKNKTPEYVVSKMLAQSGYENVQVRRSTATYR